MASRSQHIWTLEKWKRDSEFSISNRRSGLRLRFDKDVNPEIRLVFKVFADWLRCEYDFPIRVTIYIKSLRRIKSQAGDMVCGTMWQPGDHMAEPHGRIATGDYKELCEKIGKYNAMCNILVTLTHELTHYFQWLNDLPLTDIGRERQATQYAEYVLYEYLDYCDIAVGKNASSPEYSTSIQSPNTRILPLPLYMLSKLS